MEEKEFLNEKKYQKTKKKVTGAAIIVLVLGLLIGGGLIAVGIMKQGKVNSNYSEDTKAKLTEQLSEEKQKLETTKTELEAKIKPVEDQIKALDREEFTGFNDEYYAREDKMAELEKSIESDKKSLEVVTDVLDESFDHCVFDDAKNNSYTANYCSIKNQLESKTDFNKEFDSFDSIPFYMFGAFIIISSCMASGFIYMFAKRREIVAFTTQQVMPVAKEGIDEISPTVGKAAGEVAKGIKEGLEEDEK